MGRTTREEWAGRVEESRASGLSLDEYAERNGINPRSLKWWSWRLGSSAAPAPSRRSLVKAKRSEPIGPLTFVELTSSSVRLPSRAPIELVHYSKIRVRIRTDFDAATLTRVLDVLDARA